MLKIYIMVLSIQTKYVLNFYPLMNIFNGISLSILIFLESYLELVFSFLIRELEIYRLDVDYLCWRGKAIKI